MHTDLVSSPSLDTDANQALLFACPTKEVGKDLQMGACKLATGVLHSVAGRNCRITSVSRSQGPETMTELL